MNFMLSIIGIVASAIYVAAVVLLGHSRFQELSSLPLNSLGDFLAGAFGPLAILWLILGFFQQGIELRQNTEALRLQADELKNSVEQQKQLVDVSRAQMEAELEVIRYERERARRGAMPLFVFKGVSTNYDGHEAQYSSRIHNMGNHATQIRIYAEPQMKELKPNSIPICSNGESFSLAWVYMEYIAKKKAVLTINYVDSAGQQGQQQFDLIPLDSQYPPQVEINPRSSD